MSHNGEGAVGEGGKKLVLEAVVEDMDTGKEMDKAGVVAGGAAVEEEEGKKEQEDEEAVLVGTVVQEEALNAAPNDAVVADSVGPEKELKLQNQEVAE